MAKAARRPPVEPRWALLGGLVSVIATALVPLGAWSVLGVLALGLVAALGYFGVSPGLWLRRWAVVAPLVAGLGILVAWSHPARESLGLAGVAASIAAKNAVIVGVVVLLGLAYGTTGLLGGMRGLGLPAPLLVTLAFMERYVHVIGDERDRMVTARQARGARGGVGGWVERARLLGALFVRALERGERIEAALEARGWDGRELPPPSPRRWRQ